MGPREEDYSSSQMPLSQSLHSGAIMDKDLKFSLVVVDQDLKILSKAEESFLVGSVNEAERNHQVNSDDDDDSARRKEHVYESLMRNI